MRAADAWLLITCACAGSGVRQQGLPQDVAPLVLRLATERHGFVHYAQEWWQFTLRDEPFPRTAFDVPVH